MTKRTSCLYCENKGVTTMLVFDSNGRGHCPICSADWLERNTITPRKAMEAAIGPYLDLQQFGRPTINGVKR